MKSFRSIANGIYSVALYMRLSREDGDKYESDSISNQQDLLNNYVSTREEFVVWDTYKDDGYTGTNFNRPEFKRLIGDIEKGKVNCVIVKDLSRFGRSYIEVGHYLEMYFPEKNVRFIAINDNVDSLIKEYDMLMPIKNIFNEQYCRDISKKVMSAITTKQNDGKFIGSFASYGYLKSPRNKHQLIIDEYPASIVRKIYSWYIGGMSKHHIAVHLNQEGILCPSAYKMSIGTGYVNGRAVNNKYAWSYNSVAEILKREMYIGNMVQHVAQTTGLRGKQRKLNPEDYVIVKNTHPAIIDMDTWNTAQRLNKNKARNVDSSKGIVLPITGFIRCGDCGKAMLKNYGYIKKDIGKIYYYACASFKRYGKSVCTKHSIRYDLLEKIILDDLNSYISTIQDLQALVDKKLSESKPPDTNRNRDADIERTKIELDKLERLNQELYHDYKEELITIDEMKSYKSSYNDQMRMLREKIELLSNKETNEINVLESPIIKNLLKRRYIDTLDKETVAEFIEIIKIYDNNRIEITYNFSNELNLILKNEYTSDTK